MEMTKVSETNFVTSIKEGVGKHVFYLEGFINGRDIFTHNCEIPPTAKPFKIKIVEILGSPIDKGIFKLNGLTCKIKRPSNLIFQVIPTTISRPIKTFDNVYIWDYETKTWIDAVDTTSDLIPLYLSKTKAQTEYWANLYGRVKALGFSDTFCRKLFRHLSWHDLEEFIVLFNHLKENNISKSFALKIMKKAKSPKYISDAMGIPCNSLSGAKKALEIYTEE